VTRDQVQAVLDFAAQSAQTTPAPHQSLRVG